MNVLLVYPEFPKTFWSHTHALSILGKRAIVPPLGLLTVAAMLPHGWGKRLVDLNVRPLSDADLAWADCVFISGMIVHRDSARRVISRCKAAGKTVVAGGPLFAAEYALFEEVEHFVLCEGEQVMAQLVADLESGKLKRTYRSREYADMTQSPVPMWELADMEQYSCAALQFSRGCPFDCEFCNVTALLGRKPRTKTPEQVIAELDAIYARGWRGSVFFVDDNLIGSRKAARAMLAALKRWQSQHGPLRLITQVSIDLADDEALVNDMIEAGFAAVFVGIETPEAEALAECNKRQNTHRDLVADVWRLQQAGLEVQAGFIVGFDHDTPDTFRRQVEFIEKSRIVTAMVGMLHAPPGTKLADRLWREGRLAGHSSGDNTDGTTNVTPIMGITALRQGYGWLLGQLYEPRPFYRRVRAFLKAFPAARWQNPLTTQRIRPFLRATWQLGIAGRERWQYWRLLVWTLLNRPQMLPAAIRLAACGHHYRTICEQNGLLREGKHFVLESPQMAHAPALQQSTPALSPPRTGYEH